MKHFVRAARPRQWTKNLLIFAGLIFSHRLSDGNALQMALLTFFAFCFISSAGYLLNDLIDKEGDRKHPEKRNRPIASGAISPMAAVTFAVVLALCGVGFALAASRFAVYAIGIYALNQTLYVTIARKVAILDVFVISFGFLIRAVAGAWVLAVYISPWLLLCTLLLALFLGFAKRRHELALEIGTRDSLGGYSMQLLDQLIGISAGSAVIAYSVYAIQSETAKNHPLLGLTIPLPIFGVFRYLQLVYSQDRGGSPDAELIRDPWLLGTVASFMVLSVYVMTR